MKIRRYVALQMVNTLYAVFFGATVTFFFFIEAGTTPVLRLAIPRERMFFVLMLVLYYLFDWFTANVRPIGAPFNLLHFFFYLLWVFFLGMIVISMNTTSCMKFLLFGVYSVTSSIWDVYTVHHDINQEKPGGAENYLAVTHLIGHTIAAQRLCLACALTAVSALVVGYGVGHAECMSLAMWLIGTVVLMKGTRLVYLGFR